MINHMMWTLSEVCERLSVSEATVKNWIRSGLLTPGEFREEFREESFPGETAPSGSGNGAGRSIWFSAREVEDLAVRLERGEERRLSARRNKSHAGGRSNMKNYLPGYSPNRQAVTRLLRAVEEAAGQMQEKTDSAGQVQENSAGQVQKNLANRILSESVPGILLLCARRLFASAGRSLPSEVTDWFCQAGYIPSHENALFGVGREAEEAIAEIRYIPGEDTLGDLHLSLQTLRNRKKNGVYYTPLHIAKLGVDQLFSCARDTDISDTVILDPSCGTGQFLLQLPEECDPRNIRGMDIDPMAVCLTRTNLCLKYAGEPASVWTDRILCTSFLHCPAGDLPADPAGTAGTDGTAGVAGIAGLFPGDDRPVNAIIGNPPWGADFSREEIPALKTIYGVTGKGRPESAELFVLESLHHLTPGGRLTMVLPESVTSVGHCRKMREEILQRCQTESLVYLGEAFDGVQCPAILITLRVTDSPMRMTGIQVAWLDTSRRRKREASPWTRQYEIRTERKTSVEHLRFHLSDEEYELAEKCRDPRGKVYLKKQARFALGIVTGNNRKIVLSSPEDGAEPVLTGQNICRYRWEQPTGYLHFSPEKFQQCAPEEVYRAEEKLIYRFVFRRLVFARDTSGRLTLNSANILIPRHPDIQCTVAEAVLNSRVAQFLYERELRSLKVLRSHLEDFPFPCFPSGVQQELQELVVKMENAQRREDRIRLYEEIDHIVSAGYGLTEKEYRHLKEILGEEIDFL